MTSSTTEATTSQATLIPVGLPASYVGGWAVAGLASLAYLSVIVNQPAATPELDQTIEMAQRDLQPRPRQQATDTAPASTPASTHETKPAQSETALANTKSVPGQLSQDLSLSSAARQDATSDESPQFSSVASNSDINTKYVTTQQILAGRQAAQPAKSAGTSVPANPQRIVTGSIVVPPPPERGPARPAIVRTTLKPALKPTTPKTRANAPKRPAPPAIDFGPAVVKPSPAAAPAPSGLAILLATGSSVESLRLTWGILQERHGAALLDLSPRYIIKANPTSPERKFALLAGPVVSAIDIARVCGVLESEGMTCRTTSFGGNSL